MIQPLRYAIEAFQSIWHALPLPFRALFGVSMLFFVINLLYRVFKG